MPTWTTGELLYWVSVALLVGGLLSLMSVMVHMKFLDERASKVVHKVPFNQATLDAIARNETTSAKLGDAIKTYALNSNRNAAVSTTTYWETDMKACPRGVKVLMLGISGVAILGQYNGDKFFVGWCALPRKRV